MARFVKLARGGGDPPCYVNVEQVQRVEANTEEKSHWPSARVWFGYESFVVVDGTVEEVAQKLGFEAEKRNGKRDSVSLRSSD